MRVSQNIHTNRTWKRGRQSPWQTGAGPVVRGRVVRESIQAEGRNAQGEAAAILPPMVTAAAPAPPPATAAVDLPPPHLLPQHLPVAPLDLPPREGKGDVVAPHPTKPGSAAAATAHTGIVVIAVRRAGTGGGAVQSDQAATRKIAVIPGSAGVEGVDLGPETGPERGPEEVAVAAGTGIERGKGAGNAGTAVIVAAANINKRLLAKTERGGGKGVVVMRKTRKRRIKIETKRWIKRRKSQRPKRRKRRRKKGAL